MQAALSLERQTARHSASSHAVLARRLVFGAVLVLAVCIGCYWPTLTNEYILTGTVTLCSSLVCCYAAMRSPHARRAWYLLAAAQFIHVLAYVAAACIQAKLWTYAASAWAGNIGIALCWCCYIALVARSRTEPSRARRVIKLTQIGITCLALTASLGSGKLAGDGQTRVWVEIFTVFTLTTLAWITLQLRIRSQHLSRCILLYLLATLASLLFFDVLQLHVAIPELLGVLLMPMAELLLCEWVLGRAPGGWLTRPLNLDVHLLKTLQHGLLTIACVVLICFCFKQHLAAAVACASLMLVLAFIRIHLDYAHLFHERILLREEAEHLHRLATRDALTGLSNRRWFEQQGTTLLEAPHGLSIALLLIDTDRFKELNDSQGHRAGDQALCMVADILTRVCDGDLVARLGGDEFAILCVDCDHAKAARRAEGIRAGVEELSLARNLGITVSIGGAVTRVFNTLSDMLHAADIALYIVKNQGRNGSHLVQLERPASPALPSEPPSPAARNEVTWAPTKVSS